MNDSAQKPIWNTAAALLPAGTAGLILFGVPALLVLLTCILSALLAEFLFNLCIHKKQTLSDGSALVTGLLIALNLSADTPLWQCAVGSVFAIVAVKGLFGGLGKNIVNPCAAAIVFLTLAFGASTGTAPKFMGSTDSRPSLWEVFLGAHSGMIGQTCAAALLIGGLYLVLRRVIRWYVPVSFLLTVFLCYLVFTGNAADALLQVLSGGVILAAVFLISDPVTTPGTRLGKIIFCVAAGVLTAAVRQFGPYQESVFTAVLTMNLLTPLLEHWTKDKKSGGDHA
ncbi:MAG: RnfABCDGE type electron transport complex subunit D [Acutalibacter sp.]|nr:RnfABCDGE type electron transport complex subunit D [Acutalibacter sp.]